MLETNATNSEIKAYGMWDKCLAESKTIVLSYKEINGETKHLAPNGKPSELPEIYAKIVRTPTFLKWFGDWIDDKENSSKVIYATTGEPKLVYHGTTSKVDNDAGLNPRKILNKKEAKRLYHLNNQVYFTTNKERADWYAKQTARGGQGRIFSCFLNIKNPEVRIGRFRNESIFSPTKWKRKLYGDKHGGVFMGGSTFTVYSKENIMHLGEV